MPQIYKEQGQTQVTPTAPDTAIVDYAHGKQRQALDNLGTILDQTMKVEYTRQAKAEEGLKDLTKKKASQAVENAYTTFEYDPKLAKQAADKSLKTIYDAVPDGQAKAQVMAEVDIDRSGYEAKANRRLVERQEKVYMERTKDKYMQDIKTASETLSMGMATETELMGMTPEEKIQRQVTYREAEGKLARAKQMAYATDSSGNFMFSAAERAVIDDRFTNRGMYAAIDYTQDNIQNNYAGAVALRDRFVNEKSDVMMAYGMDEETYVKSVKSMDAIISGQRTGEQEKQNQVSQVILGANVKDMGLEADQDGNVKIGNKKYNNLNDTTALYNGLLASESAGHFPDRAEKEKLAEYKAKVGQAIITQVENGVKPKSKFFDWGAINTGEAGVQQANKNVAAFVANSGITDPQAIINLKAQLYTQTYGELKNGGVNPEDTQSQEIAKGAANKAYIAYVQRIVGKQTVPEGQDALVVYNNALSNYKKNVAYNSLQTRLRGQ